MKADAYAGPAVGGCLHGLGLSHAEWKRLSPRVVRRRSIRRGEVLFVEGDAFSSLYEVHAGCFKTCATSANGREQVCGFQITGDFVGLEGIGSDCHVSAGIALEDSQVNVVPFLAISQLSRESADFQHHFHKIMAREHERSRHMMFLLGSMQAMERLVTFLLDLLQRLNARGYSATCVNLSMTRDEIGSYLGLTLETVSRMFAKLKQARVLEVSNRLIRILNPEALGSMAAGLDRHASPSSRDGNGLLSG